MACLAEGIRDGSTRVMLGRKLKSERAATAQLELQLATVASIGTAVSRALRRVPPEQATHAGLAWAALAPYSRVELVVRAKNAGLTAEPSYSHDVARSRRRRWRSCPLRFRGFGEMG